MADQRQSDVLGALPRRRPQRRSAKRPARADSASSRPANGANSQSTAEATRAPEAPTTQSRTRPRPATATKNRGPGQANAVPRVPSPPRSTAKPKAGARRQSKTDRLRQPPQPRGIPSQPRSPVPASPHRPEILGTFVQAAAELTEIGLSLGAHVLRRAVSRLPRP